MKNLRKSTLMGRLIVTMALALFLLPINASAESKEALPLAAGICINKVESLIQKNKLKEAIALLENFKAKQKEVDTATAAKKGYTHYYIDFLLGNTLLMRSEADTQQRTALLKQAAAAYEKAVSKKPDLAPAWLNLAKCHYDLGRMKAAAHAFTRGYDVSETKNADHLYYGAICYFQSNAHAEALKTFNRLIRQHPDKFSLEWRETFVSLLFAMDKNKTALPHVETLARQFSGDKKKKWQEILFYQYLQLNMGKKALAYGKMLTRTDPTEPKWWKGVSHLYLNRNDLKNGLSYLIIYSYLTPPTREEKSLMADLYLSLGIPGQASAFYEMVLNEKKEFSKINRIIHAYTAAHEPEKAIAWIDRGLALKQDLDLLKRKANLQYEMKQYAKAARTYEQLARQSKRPGEFLLLLGYCAWNMDQPLKAKKAFQKASEFGKQKKAALQAIDQLNRIINSLPRTPS